MCGRYALALRPSEVRAYLEDDSMPVNEAPSDDDDNHPRQSYNFAPGYHGIVYRADTPDKGAGSSEHEDSEASTSKTQEPHDVQYKLQSMKWGLIPFWTKRNPDYGSMMKTINCRDDSLIENKGLWNTMKQKKRCIIIVQGFYEWLKKGKDKMPHYTKRKDGKLMCLAGLWDCVQYEGSEEKLYTYTIITTDSNPQLRFLHDRMPVILDNGSEDLRTWLDPNRATWSKELQSLLRPYDGELEVYPVAKEVGKVGNNSPNFIVPLTSSENKSNIANFFGKPPAKKASEEGPKPEKSKTSPVKTEKKDEEDVTGSLKHEEETKPEKTENNKHNLRSNDGIKQETSEERATIPHTGTEDNAPLPVPKSELMDTDTKTKSLKREIDDVPSPDEAPPSKAAKHSNTPPEKPARKTRSATSNNTESPSKNEGKDKGSMKITSFFGK